ITEVIVKPFIIKDKEFTPPNGTVIADDKTPYIFTPVITFDTANNKPLPPDVAIDNVQWTTEPPIGEESGLAWGKPAPTTTTNDKGQLEAALVSSKPVKEAKVFLQMDGMEKTQVGSVSFEENPALFQVDTINISPPPDTPLVADGKQTYTYTATVLDGNKQPINKKVTISHVNWGIGKDSNNKNLIWKPSNGDVATNEKGELTATLASHEKIENVTVSLSIEEKPSVEAKAVSFIRDTSGDRVSSKIQLTPQSPIFINAKIPYTFTAQYHDGEGNSLPNTKIPGLTWNITQDGNPLDSDILNKLTFTNSGDTTDNNGNITATLNSSIVIDRLMVTLSTSKGPSVDAPNDVAFIDNPKNFQIQNNRIEVESTPPGKKVLTSDGTQKFTYTAVIVGSDGTTPVEEGTEIENVQWGTDPQGLNLVAEKGTVQAGKDGKLTATLTSTSDTEIDGIKVSLAIENHAAVWVADTDKVAFKPETMKIIPDNPGPKLVNDSYTYTVTLKNSEGGNEVGKTVTWAFAQNIPGVTFTTPVATQTDSQGEAQVTITSTTKASNVIVTASTDNNIKRSAPPVEFNWPTVAAITPTQPNGTVNAGGEYDFTAKIVGADGTSEYSGSKFKFAWKITKPADLAAAGLSLSPAEADSVSNGELKAALKSDAGKPAAQDIEVCLNVVGAGEASPPGKCISSINFATPPEDFEIKQIEVTPSATPLTGNGKDHITYKALIIKKNAGGKPEPIKEHTFTNVSWAIDDKHNTIKELKISPSLYEGKQYTTDKDGYLIATLSSSENVGVNKVFVKLTVEEGQYHHSADSTSESFEPVPLPAVLFVYNQYNKQKNKIFYEPHPTNLLLSTAAELRALSDPKTPFNKKELKYSAQGNTAYTGEIMVNLGNNDQGPLIINAPGEATITANITKTDGRIYLYQYHNKSIRIISSLGKTVDADYSGYYPLYGDTFCESSNLNNSTFSLINEYTPNINFLDKSQGPDTVFSEYDNLFDWGVFTASNDTQATRDEQTIIAYSGNTSNKVIYNANTGLQDPGADGLIVCSLSSQPSY
ncbi:hypothetical protein, partial [Xenorhabdus littoralis]|uniref:hypothetical protein n=1 Tax=Xenorhabdus littoralis TaxID=2582835 RepID=UPI0029E7D2E2